MRLWPQPPVTQLQEAREILVAKVPKPLEEVLQAPAVALKTNVLSSDITLFYFHLDKTLLFFLSMVAQVALADILSRTT